MATVSSSMIQQRRRLIIQGFVQGVGFRPFVYRLALSRHLTGFILNSSSGVTIEIEGLPQLLDDFQSALQAELPPLARIDQMVVEAIAPQNDSAFTIIHSQAGSERQALISPDTAVCEDCQRELFDPSNRRYQYAFTNCTNCGPRFTIIQDVPYDRDKTTMSHFTMCLDCQAEYDDPLNRRFHAQPNACPNCGPKIQLVSAHDLRPLSAAENPLVAAARYLIQGKILAVKGLGGYHLACDALNGEAVKRLRQRKHREAKPFALMVPDLATVNRLCHVDAAETALLQSHRRPIVLLSQLDSCPVASDVAPGFDTLGIMLPYTPLHYLLLSHFAQMIHDQPAVLVMTSGNISEEPIAYRDNDAYQRLPHIADMLVTHNRSIHMCCDDTVMRVTRSGEQFLRRSRGYTPEPLALPFELPLSLLACGAHLKNTFCLGKQHQAFISHHIGDLENMETLTSFREGIEHFERLFDITPQALAYDLHPEYLATKYALASEIPLKIAVQHHHAHIASVMAEHGLTEPVIGIAADGTGYGLDEAIWGGEVLLADLVDFQRFAHLTYVALPGGEQAIRQPWRMAAVYLREAYGDAFLSLDIPFVRRLPVSTWRTLTQMIERGLNAPLTSSLGRLFDAVAALLGLRDKVLYEGQAAIELEILALKSPEASTDFYPFTITDQLPAQLNVFPMIQAIVVDLSQHISLPVIARRFHNTISELFVTICCKARVQSGRQIAVLSGGVFQNRLLLEQLTQRLLEEHFQVYTNNRVPPNDGGISLGQLVIAAARLRAAKKEEQ